MSEKPKFPLIEKYNLFLETGKYRGKKFDVVEAKDVEKILSKAEQEGAKAERERILKIIEYVFAEEKEVYFMGKVAWEKLKAELEKEVKK